VEYGTPNIQCEHSSPQIKNSTIRFSSSNGIYLTGDAQPTIGGDGIGNIISNSGSYGIGTDGLSPTPTIIGNTLTNNGAAAMRLRPWLRNVSNNTGTGNGTVLDFTLFGPKFPNYLEPSDRFSLYIGSKDLKMVIDERIGG
jgi:hypothetical protein